MLHHISRDGERTREGGREGERRLSASCSVTWWRIAGLPGWSYEECGTQWEPLCLVIWPFDTFSYGGGLQFKDGESLKTEGAREEGGVFTERSNDDAWERTKERHSPPALTSLPDHAIAGCASLPPSLRRLIGRGRSPTGLLTLTLEITFRLPPFFSLPLLAT